MRSTRLALALALVASVACSSSSDDDGGGGSGTGTGTGSGTGTGTGTGTGSSSSSGVGGDSGERYGQVYEGGEFHLGPVDYAETQWHNACAPGGGYIPEVQQVDGVMLAGLWNGIPEVERYCDACIFVETDMGKSALLRVVTYGDTTPNSIDVSPEAYAVLDSGEYPRTMHWQFAKCPDSGPVLYEFQTGSNEWWTSLWVRNARVPLESVEVDGENQADFVELSRASDGTVTEASGFGAGPFTMRLTGVDGQSITHTFDWPAGGIAGALLTAPDNFD
jgi:hypothetical protein